MTREDAIKTLKELWRETNDPWYEEVYNMAIDALNAGRITQTEPQTEMVKCYKCRWWNYSYGCGNPKGICEFEERYQVKRSE